MKSKVPFKIIDEPFLSAALFISILLLAPDVPTWVFIVSMVIWIWRLSSEFFGFYRPSRLITSALSLLLLGAVYISFSTLLGREASVSFLVLLSSIKILEINSEKEKLSLIIFGFFLVVSKLIFSIDLIYICLAIPICIELLSGLLPRSISEKSKTDKYKLVLYYSIISLPITLFLFFFFPRFSQTLAQSHGSRFSLAQTGFAEVVGQGQIENLLDSDELVMRVEIFSQSQSNQFFSEDLYWKGTVLNKANGFVWKKEMTQGLRENIDSANMNEKLTSNENVNFDQSFKVTIEAHFKNWIFVLPNTLKVLSESHKIRQSPLGDFKFDSDIENRTAYEGFIRKNEKNYYNSKYDSVQFSGISEKMMTLLNEIKKRSKSNKPEDLIESIVSFYKEKKFRYTMRPGDQVGANLDDFIFNKRKGFCEHFASATALMLLGVGVPARVIAGYQGGVYNFIGNFWEVRQKDAHTWIEYVNSKNVWTPFDPVQYIAPLRISMGGSRYSELNDHEILLENGKTYKELPSLESLLLATRYLYENLNFRWNQKVLSFDLDQQKIIFNYINNDIGLLVFLSLSGAILLSLLLNVFFRPKERVSQSQQIYQLINRWASQFNMSKFPNEGPLNWRDRIIKAFPESRESITTIFDCYLNEAYKKPTNEFILGIIKNNKSNQFEKVKKLIKSIKFKSNL